MVPDLPDECPRTTNTNKGSLEWSMFPDDFQRDRSERLEWLEKALGRFLPMVVSSDVEPE